MAAAHSALTARIVFLLTLSLPMLGGPAVAAAATHGDAADKITNAHRQRIAGQVAGTGRARVIVSLDVDLPQPSARGRHAAMAALEEWAAQDSIAQTQDRVVARLSRVERKTLKRFRNLPLMALEVDADDLARLVAADEVTAVQEDVAVPAALASSTGVIGARTAWDSGYSGYGQMVAILDTGVDTGHEHFAGKQIVEACFSSTYPGTSDTLCPDASDEQVGAGAAEPCLGLCSHGTHVASIAVGNGDAAGTASGVAKDADLLAVQVFSYFPTACNGGPCIKSWTSDQIAALDYVYSLRDSYPIAAVNMSLAGDLYNSSAACDSANVVLKAAIDRLRSAGIATVASAGNDGISGSIAAPACISSAISVGSTEDNDTVSSFSNGASWLSLYAPGSNITAAVPWNDIYGIKSGTSMAAPHVAGAFAVLKDEAGQRQQPDVTVDALLETMRLTGRPVWRNGYPVPRLDLGRASAVSGTFGSAPVIDLQMDRMDTGSYGYRYGSNAHYASLQATFARSDTRALTLTLRGYDVDFEDEIGVWLNGNLLGYLGTGSNNALNGGDSFALPESFLVSGQNRIEFRQSTPGFVWGVTELLIESSGPAVPGGVVALALDRVDTGAYGHGYGSDAHYDSLTAAFDAAAGSELTLSVTGYDIDGNAEVSVWLNGLILGHLGAGPNNGLNSGNLFRLPAAMLVAGRNTVEFRQQTPGYVWGVTRLAVLSGIVPGAEDVVLTVGQVDYTKYGHGFGTNRNYIDLVAAFDTDARSDLSFAVTGYDIDYNNEVSVWLNGRRIGYLGVGPNNAMSAGDVFALPRARLVAGRNLLEIRERKGGFVWGATRLLVRSRSSGYRQCDLY